MAQEAMDLVFSIVNKAIEKAGLNDEGGGFDGQAHLWIWHLHGKNSKGECILGHFEVGVEQNSRRRPARFSVQVVYGAYRIEPFHPGMNDGIWGRTFTVGKTDEQEFIEQLSHALLEAKEDANDLLAHFEEIVQEETREWEETVAKLRAEGRMD